MKEEVVGERDRGSTGVIKSEIFARLNPPIIWYKQEVY